LLTACGGGGGGGGGESTADATAPTALLATSTAVTTTYNLYVATTGSNSNSGTQSSPFRTIQHAASVAKPSTTVHVAPGTYAEKIISTVSGTSSQRIIYVSDTKWGAKIVPPSGSGSTLWQAKGGFTDIVGFDFSAVGTTVVSMGIMFTGGYSSAQNNHVHHIGNLPLVCGSTNGAAIESASDPVANGHTALTGNVVHDIGQGSSCSMQGLYLATSGTIKNNLVYNVGWGAIYLWHDNQHVDIANNTIFHSLYGIVYGSGDQNYSTSPADYINVSNNIVYGNTNGIRNGNLGTLGAHNTFTNNLVYNNTTNWTTTTAHTGDVTADPQFVNYISTGGGDYHLKSTSPAIDKGLLTYAPSTDLDGAVRPQGLGPDIGSYEFASLTATVTPTPTPTPTPSPTPTTAYNFYVATTGSDSNSGSQSAPFKTIQHAANVAKPDTTVHVAAGTYSENVTTNASGTSSARI